MPATIYALSTSPGKAGVAVVRVSGAYARRALDRMVTKPVSAPRTTYFRRIRHPVSREALDRGLVVWFPGTNLIKERFAFHLF